MFDLDDCLAFITARSAKIFVAGLERRFRSYSVTRIQWIAMFYIHENKGITQRELADKMAVKEPTVVRLTRELEQEGIVFRMGSDTDKRIKRLLLTEKGERVYQEMLPVAETFKNDTISGIGSEELQTLKDVLNKMVENAQRPS